MTIELEFILKSLVKLDFHSNIVFINYSIATEILQPIWGSYRLCGDEELYNGEISRLWFCNFQGSFMRRNGADIRASWTWWTAGEWTGIVLVLKLKAFALQTDTVDVFHIFSLDWTFIFYYRIEEIETIFKLIMMSSVKKYWIVCSVVGQQFHLFIVSEISILYKLSG